MGEKKKKNSESIVTNRRKFLKGSSGALLAGIEPLSNISGRIERTKRIVTARGGRKSRIKETKVVPVRWDEHSTIITKIHKKLVDKYQNHPAVDHLALESSNKSIGGLNISQPVIRALEEVPPSKKTELPTTIHEAGISAPNGVLIDEIKIEETKGETKLVGHGGCHSLHTEDPLPGGVYIGVKGNTSSGTAGYRAVDSDGVENLITANHVAANDECDVKYPDMHGYPTSTYPDAIVGPVTDGDARHDWASFKADGQDITNISNKIWYSEGETVPIAGYKTAKGLQTMMDNNEKVEKQGQTLGHNQGEITAIYNSSGSGCTGMDSFGVEITNDTASGDSGGPIWEHNSSSSTDEYANIIGHTVMGKNRYWPHKYADCNDAEKYVHTVGWPAYYLHDEHGFSIGN